MKLQMTLFAATVVLFIGCGKSKSSSSDDVAQPFQAAGECSQETAQWHTTLMSKKSERLSRNSSQAREMAQTCSNLRAAIGTSSCHTYHVENRTVVTISYDDVASFCAEVGSYYNQGGRGGAPRPSPRNLSIPIQNLNSNYSIRFKKPYLDAQDMLQRNDRIKCNVVVEQRNNLDLRAVKPVVQAVQVTRTGSTYFEIIAAARGSSSLVHVNCRSANSSLTVREVNDVMVDVLEIKNRL